MARMHARPMCDSRGVLVPFRCRKSRARCGWASQWKVYGDNAEFGWQQQQNTTHNTTLNRVLVPLTASTLLRRRAITIAVPHLWRRDETRGQLLGVARRADRCRESDAAEGIGALAIRGETGLTSNWTALKGGPINLRQPYVMAAPGRIAITDLSAGNALCQQEFALWKDKLDRSARLRSAVPLPRRRSSSTPSRTGPS